MTEKTDKKRAAPISYRPPASLRDEFHTRVERSGLPVNAFITHAVFDSMPPRSTRRPPIEKQMLAQLLAEAASIRDRLDELAAGEHGGSADIVGTALDDLAVMRAALLKMMERAP